MDDEKCIGRNSPPHILEREKKLAQSEECVRKRSKQSSDKVRITN